LNQSAAIVEIRDLGYTINGRPVFGGLDMDFPRGRVTAVMGPSGTGKTTLLRLITGQVAADSGSLLVAGQDMRAIRRADLYVLRRRMGMLFQNGALLTDLSVFENVAFPLREHTDLPERLIRQLVLTKLQAVGLRGAAELMPAELSGGMSRRVALARAIVRRPQAFLMDEPLSNLDAKLRVQTRAELVELQRRLQATVIYVTHDQVEAMTMGHRIAILDQGVVQQLDPPQHVYERPANLFVARFIGTPPMNTIEGRLVSDGADLVFEASGIRLALAAGLGRAARTAQLDGAVLGVRPEDLRLDPDGPITAKLVLVESLGHERHLIAHLDDGQVLIVRQSAHEPTPRDGEVVRLGASSTALHLFDPATQQRVDG